jgi:hypothetical protein
LAGTEYAKKKGIDLTWYRQVKFSLQDGKDEYERIDDYKSCNNMFTYSTKSDLGASISKLKDVYYASFYDNEERTDPDLIEVIERLGDLANGSCAKLAIAEIPDGASFEIDEYDGNESVVPPRQSW